MTGNPAKDRALGNACGYDSLGDGPMSLSRDRHRSDSPLFADEIGDQPASFPELKVIAGQDGRFRATEPGANQQCQRRRIANTLNRG